VNVALKLHKLFLFSFYYNFSLKSLYKSTGALHIVSIHNLWSFAKQNSKPKNHHGCRCPKAPPRKRALAMDAAVTKPKIQHGCWIFEQLTKAPNRGDTDRAMNTTAIVQRAARGTQKSPRMVIFGHIVENTASPPTPPHLVRFSNIYRKTSHSSSFSRRGSLFFPGRSRRIRRPVSSPLRRFGAPDRPAG
jgi:hypothetical protein